MAISSFMRRHHMGGREIPTITIMLSVLAIVVTLTAPDAIDEMTLWLRPFDHGFEGFGPYLHLTMNLALLAILGPRLERWLGSTKVLLLVSAAYLAYVGAMAVAAPIWDLEAVGLSGIVWAMALPTLWAAPTSDERRSVTPIVWLMLVFIPIGFAVAVGLGSDRFLAGAFAANTFHFVGVVVSLVIWPVIRPLPGR